MRELVWSSKFIRIVKKKTRSNSELIQKLSDTLKLLEQDPFHHKLHTHKLKGQFENSWACTIDYDNRIIFEFMKNPESGEDEILLLTLGSHDNVY